METCVHCKTQYDINNLKRSLGEESAPVLRGFCSAKCYTVVTMAKNKPTPRLEREMQSIRDTAVGIRGLIDRLEDTTGIDMTDEIIEYLEESK